MRSIESVVIYNSGKGEGDSSSGSSTSVKVRAREQLYDSMIEVESEQDRVESECDEKPSKMEEGERMCL